MRVADRGGPESTCQPVHVVGEPAGGCRHLDGGKNLLSYRVQECLPAVHVVVMTHRVGVQPASQPGAAVATRLVAEGARVILTDIADGDGTTLATKLGDAAIYQHVDVADGADWDRLAANVIDRYGRIDVVHANGPGRIVPTVPIHQLTSADWDRQISVSLTSAYHAARLFCPPAGPASGEPGAHIVRPCRHRGGRLCRVRRS
jgi:hypothetical protein